MGDYFGSDTCRCLTQKEFETKYNTATQSVYLDGADINERYPLHMDHSTWHSENYVSGTKYYPMFVLNETHWNASANATEHPTFKWESDTSTAYEEAKLNDTFVNKYVRTFQSTSYGIGCKNHDRTIHPFCADAAGTPWTDDTRPGNLHAPVTNWQSSWCNSDKAASHWCYVDADSCASGFDPAASSGGKNFIHPNRLPQTANPAVTYSYKTCSMVGDYPSDVDTDALKGKGVSGTKCPCLTHKEFRANHPHVYHLNPQGVVGLAYNVPGTITVTSNLRYAETQGGIYGMYVQRKTDLSVKQDGWLAFYRENYGIGCKNHDSARAPFCKKPGTAFGDAVQDWGTTPSYFRTDDTWGASMLNWKNAYCGAEAKWCYIDPANCHSDVNVLDLPNVAGDSIGARNWGSDQTSAEYTDLVHNASHPEPKFQTPVYSYATCSAAVALPTTDGKTGCSCMTKAAFNAKYNETLIWNPYDTPLQRKEHVAKYKANWVETRTLGRRAMAIGSKAVTDWSGGTIRAVISDNYGIGCGNHDFNYNPVCQTSDGTASGQPELLGAPKKWTTENGGDGEYCTFTADVSKKWCYVDPDNCNIVQDGSTTGETFMLAKVNNATHETTSKPEQFETGKAPVWSYTTCATTTTNNAESTTGTPDDSKATTSGAMDRAFPLAGLLFGVVYALM